MRPRHLTPVTRVALLANEKSGSKRSAEELERLLTENGATVRTFPIGEMEQAATWRPDRFAVAGGDGSIAPVASTAGAAGAPLALIPSGTANDFARGMGISDDPEGACRLAATGTRERTMELGHMDHRPFVNVASAGLAVNAARRALPFKKALGPFAYVVGALDAGVRAAPVECRLERDGERIFEGRAWQVIVSSTGRFGAGSSVREADPSDGQLDVTVIEARSRHRLVRHAYGLRTGRIVEQDGVHHTRALRLELHVPADTAYNVDGEILTHGSARFSAEHAAFRLIVP
jgi:diacylglycerol kinase (ATP)